MNVIALAKPDCLYCGYIFTYAEAFNSTKSMCQEAFIKKTRLQIAQK